MTTLQGQVALVTGASRGVGRGIAASLSDSGATVYATGRTVADAVLPSAVKRLPCDHSVDDAVAGVFQRIREEAGRLDILVNSAWGGYERMVEDGRFTWPARFWDQHLWRWDAMVGVGVRAAFVASQHAARLMVPAGRGLIVNLSYWAARKHIGNVIYGVAKAATDKLTADMARELREHASRGP
jgi:dehydrogenase/reductase SDR family member 1